MPTVRYKFDENILKLSSTNDINQIGDEWVKIDSKSLSTPSGHCICQKNNIKHIIYCYNIITKTFITVGRECSTKFGKRIKRTGNPLIVDMFKQYIKDISYELIDDVFAYSENIKQKLEEHIEKQYKNRINLDELLSNIKELIDDYGFVGLTELYTAINLTISRERMERCERERQERERCERERQEREQREREQKRKREVKSVVTFEMLLKQKKQEQQEREQQEREQRNREQRKREQRERTQMEREEKEKQEREQQERVLRQKNYIKQIFDRDKKCTQCNINYCKCHTPRFIRNANNKQICSCCKKRKCNCIKLTNFYYVKTK